MEKIQLTQTALPGVLLLEPKIFEDDRGWFYESWNKSLYSSLGINDDFVQDNESFSVQGVIRGLHYQKGEYAQSKLVRVLSGEILDIVVDIRLNSPTFGEYIGVHLSALNHKQLYIPRGFAHGFAAKSETVHLAYKCDNFYSPAHEGSILADDPDLKIDWETPREYMIFSVKDRRAQSFASYIDNPDFIFKQEV